MAAPAALPTAATTTTQQQDGVYAPLEQQAKEEGEAGRSDVEQPPPCTTAAAVSAGDALRHSFTVGLSGGGATVFSVATMMWLHTIITYQQRHGTAFGDTCKVGGMTSVLLLLYLCTLGWAADSATGWRRLYSLGRD